MKTNKEYIDNLKMYFLWSPFSGIILFFVLAPYYFVFQKEAITYLRIIWILVPFISFFLISLPFNLILSKFPPYLVGRFKLITLSMIILTGVVIFSQKDNINIPVYKSESLNEMINNIDDVNYLIFTSDNCPYCKEMETNYRKIANEYKDLSISYIDLTNIPLLEKPQVIEKLNGMNIKLIPTLVQLKGGKVEKQIVGKQSLTDLEAFFKNE